MQRWRIALALLGALVFVALAWPIWSVGDRLVGGVILVIFFPLVLVLVIMLVRPPFIELDDRGLTVHRPPFGTQRDAWTEIGPVTTWQGLPKIVTFESPGFAAAHGWTSRLNRSLDARGATLQPWIGGLKADQLASLLNAYRDAYGRTANT